MEHEASMHAPLGGQFESRRRFPADDSVSGARASGEFPGSKEPSHQGHDPVAPDQSEPPPNLNRARIDSNRPLRGFTPGSQPEVTRKNLDEEGLLELGDSKRSSDPFVAKVAILAAGIDRSVRVLSANELTGLDDPKIVDVTNPISKLETPKGFGYLASSSSRDPDVEALWTAIVAETWRRADYHPIVLPIDQFYAYRANLDPSLVLKTRTFAFERSRDEQGRPYAFILSGVSESQLFTPEILAAIPYQEHAGIKCEQGIFQSGENELGDRLLSFAWSDDHSGLTEAISKAGSLKGFLAELDQNLGNSDPRESFNARLLVATALLLQDGQTWKDLQYAERDEGVPLFVVAPDDFHRAVNRLNFRWSEAALDYLSSASGSLGASRSPLLNGTLSGSGVPTALDQYEALKTEGLSREEFERVITPLLTRWESIYSEPK